MTSTQKTTLAALSTIACIVFLVALYIASQVYQEWSQKPLGPTLAYPTELQLPATWTASPAAFASATPLTAPATLAPTLTFETETPSSPFLACRDLPAMTVLAIGTDVRPGQRRHGLTDVMRAVRVDFQGQRLTALEFPRDLWVRIPELEGNLKTDHQKLNTAYAHGGSEYGTSLLARTLDLNFGLKGQGWGKRSRSGQRCR